MRKLTLEIINNFNQILGGQPSEDGTLRAVDLAEVLDYAAAYNFDTDHVRANLNYGLSLKGASPIAPVSIAQKIHLARTCDTMYPGQGFEAKEIACIEQLNAIYGVNGSDYDPATQVTIDVPALPC